MLILGIDPGIATTGYGLVESIGQELTAVEYGVIETKAELCLSERLQTLYRNLREVIGRGRPQVAAIEELFFSRNARTAMIVGHARGVALLAAAEAGLSVFEYTPLEVKDAVAGYGRASKGQMQDMTRLLLKLDSVPRPDDAADALAVAICHAHSSCLAAILRDRTGGQGHGHGAGTT